MPRRAFLLMPVAFGGAVAIFARRERSLPDPQLSGSGEQVQLHFFADDGKEIEARTIRKLVRTDAEWRSELPSDVFAVTRRGATEMPFTGRYWNDHAQGIYRCVACGSAVFKSEDKFDSGTGWPSFRLPIAGANVYTRADRSLGEERLEVLCRKCDAHLGHVFPDGPAPAGLRYCINSAALRFHPLSGT